MAELLPAFGLDPDDPILDAARRMDLRDFTAAAHHTFGRMLRNQLGLWNPESAAHQWFVRRGVHHADDMSGLLMIGLWHAARGEEPDSEEWAATLERYRIHWWNHDRDGMGELYGPPKEFS